MFNLNETQLFPLLIPIYQQFFPKAKILYRYISH